MGLVMYAKCLTGDLNSDRSGQNASPGTKSDLEGTHVQGFLANLCPEIACDPFSL